jgi:hypothetical protein
MAGRSRLPRRPHQEPLPRLLLRVEVFNLFNHANILGRQAVYGDATTPNPNFGQALAGLANIDPPRMVQLQARFLF